MTPSLGRESPDRDARGVFDSAPVAVRGGGGAREVRSGRAVGGVSGGRTRTPLDSVRRVTADAPRSVAPVGKETAGESALCRASRGSILKSLNLPTTSVGRAVTKGRC